PVWRCPASGRCSTKWFGAASRVPCTQPIARTSSDADGEPVMLTKAEARWASSFAGLSRSKYDERIQFADSSTPALSAASGPVMKRLARPNESSRVIAGGDAVALPPVKNVGAPVSSSDRVHELVGRRGISVTA